MDYLPGLNTLRFYAALSVVISHISDWQPGVLSGWNAVSLFFVLSGYLISYRLLREREQTGRIDLKAFYVRRELRILPLYYLVFLVGSVLLPALGAPVPTSTGYATALLLSPQFALADSRDHLGQIGHLWSIGTEEWFYFIFPVLVRRIRFPALCKCIIVASVLIGGLAYIGSSPAFPLFKFMRYECMAVGGLAAWVVVTHSPKLRFVFHPVAQMLAILTLAGTILFDVMLPIHDLTFSIAVAALLANVSRNPRSLVKIEWRGSRTVGDLTYGIYLWHLPLIWVVEQLTTDRRVETVVVVALTLVVAVLSYRFIETPFLRLKSRFAPHRMTEAAPA